MLNRICLINQHLRQGTSLTLSYEGQIGDCGQKKMIRLFLIGMLFGVMITAAVHVCVRNSSQQRLLANGNLETRWRGLDL